MLKSTHYRTLIAIVIVLGTTAVLYILSLPFIVLLLPLFIWVLWSERAERKEFKKFLESINGINFFCYNNRKDSKDYIEKNILPILASDIKVIYLDGRGAISEYEQKFISKLLYSIREETGFPYLLKISNGKLIERSINNDFYNTMNQNKDIGLLNKIIIEFYQTN